MAQVLDVDPGLNVVLTGFMGSGKTTVGRIVACKLGWSFVDTDELIEEQYGSIEAIFAERGEAAFRTLERQVAAQVATGRSQVIATGGRMLLDSANAEVLTGTGRVFCLAADANEIIRRLQACGDGTVRPLLTGDDPAKTVADLLAERAVGYSQFEQVQTAGRSPDEIAADIIGRLSRPSP